MEELSAGGVVVVGQVRVQTWRDQEITSVVSERGACHKQSQHFYRKTNFNCELLNALSIKLYIPMETEVDCANKSV